MTANTHDSFGDPIDPFGDYNEGCANCGAWKLFDIVNVDGTVYALCYKCSGPFLPDPGRLAYHLAYWGLSFADIPAPTAHHYEYYDISHLAEVVQP